VEVKLNKYDQEPVILDAFHLVRVLLCHNASVMTLMFTFPGRSARSWSKVKTMNCDTDFRTNEDKNTFSYENVVAIT